MVRPSAEESAIWEALGEIADPEIPVLSLVELGVIRRVSVTEGRAFVDIIPTFSACPAFDIMVSQVRDKLHAMGFEEAEVRTVYDPPWSTDRLSTAAREKLRQFGLAVADRSLEGLRAAPCPRCGSTKTRLTNSFGCTPCRAIAVCDECREPFEQLKAL